MIGEVTNEEEEVEVTIDSGAAVNVWQMKNNGVPRRKLAGKKPKFAAASGTAIAVTGEATLEFEAGGKVGHMNFLDADVNKPLGQ